MNERLILHIRITPEVRQKLNDLMVARDKAASEVVRDLIRNSHKSMVAK